VRVGLVINSLSVGGAERQVVKLCTRIVSKEIAIRLFLLLRDEPSDLRSEVPSHVPVEMSPYGRRDPRMLYWLATRFNEQQLDVVHSFLWYADFVTAFSKAVFRWPQRLVCSERGDRGRSLYHTRERLLDRLVTFRHADAYCTNSKAGQETLQRAGVSSSSRIHVIPNGIDLARVNAAPRVDARSIFGWPRSADVVGLVSRLVWYKGVDTLIRALARLNRQRDVRCVIIGDGPARLGLERKVAELGIESQVSFLGARFPVESFVKGFDVAVLATRTDTEHCSNSILEYMACGCPVVATRVSGNGELVLDGETGYLVEPDDDTAMATRIAQLLTNRDIARQMGAQARARVESQFDITRVAAQFLNLWEQVVA
jgi:glycosyltransferase involved in cell wall biosynthesis